MNKEKYYKDQLTFFNEDNKDQQFKFNGDTYNPIFDNIRLTGQIKRVYNFIKDGKWYTLDEISKKTNDPHASISAQLRHLRKKRFGSHVIEKRPRGNRENGLWEYKIIINKNSNIFY